MIDPVTPACIEFGGTLADTAELHAWLDAFFAAHPAEEAQAHAVRLCLEEAVMNSVMHGYAGQPGAVTVSLWREDGCLVARVTDSAPEFDPTSAPPSLPGAEQSKPGGRGIYLLHRFARGLAYSREGGRNQLTMRFPD